MRDWSKPQPDLEQKVRPVGLTVYCTTGTMCRVCPGYSTLRTNEALNDEPSRCACACHEEGRG